MGKKGKAVVIMGHILVVYESRTGHVRRMAEAVAEGVRGAGSEARLLSIDEAEPQDLLNAAGIIAGSYTSYGVAAGGTKAFFDKTYGVHGKLNGKVGGAFASCAGLGGGCETTVLSLLQMMLVHGMIVQGNPAEFHFGAVAIGAPDARSLEACRSLGKRTVELAEAVAGI
ncbi:MAG: flavodoxin domain-containing protein [Anaerolineales bacterium]|nr:flavodoxin domain-containing protein [Anaerolineales bacterium]